MAGSASITGLYTAEGADFVTRAVDRLDLTRDGIDGDRHWGPTRLSGPREPWHPRGTVIRNDRQVSILGEEELATIAAAMTLPSLPAEWIGGNLVLAGIPDLSRLAVGSRLMAPSGATLFVTGYNKPCRKSGQSIAGFTGIDGHTFGFVRAARGMRGLVAYVERAGLIAIGDEMRVVPAVTAD
ncbi:molybdenum cofactor sulfurase [Phreatobacter aquaticus]|uniref:Molybdenum cofactor sulfurase n=1 Tax=Phreatobacter aquaticus TaxID=2570229 RepID=A0A4D7QGZ1_9HYPH|nr:MOSC domain-containing protein [Phreatobacter aquaticus]QCK84953.1 molybdenum cofactor sulfurase [Phreatobacter aquaticus]